MNDGGRVRRQDRQAVFDGLGQGQGSGNGEEGAAAEGEIMFFRGYALL